MRIKTKEDRRYRIKLRLRKRIAALDGSFAVSSPRGGPTVVRAEIPCG